MRVLKKGFSRLVEVLRGSENFAAVNSSDIARRVLARAAAKLGGVEALASHLMIGPRILRHYIAGSEPVPNVLFLRAVDIILDELPQAQDAAARRGAGQ